MMTRAAILTAALCLLASSAFAGTLTRPVMVGAVVARSAVIRATTAGRANSGVRLEQVASRGTPAPMLLAAGELKPIPQSGATQLPGSATGDMTVTLLY